MNSCGKIQNLGARKDETGIEDESDADKCLEKCKEMVEQAKSEFREAEAALRRYYHDE